MATNDEQKPFRFDYEKYETKGITVEDMQKNIELLQSKTTNVLDAIFMMIRVVGIGICYWVIKNKIAEQERIEKQRYEQKRTSDNAGTISNDDMDVIDTQP